MSRWHEVNGNFPRHCKRRARSSILRHCEERSDEAIHPFFGDLHGLLRFARNDEVDGRDASRRRSDRAVTVRFGRQRSGWEVAYAALFLMSNESSYVNAHTLFLDAGHLAGIVRS